MSLNNILVVEDATIKGYFVDRKEPFFLKSADGMILMSMEDESIQIVNGRCAIKVEFCKSGHVFWIYQEINGFLSLTNRVQGINFMGIAPKHKSMVRIEQYRDLIMDAARNRVLH